MQLPENILNWLLKRGISEQVIINNKLSWDGAGIVIPIYNDVGEKVFHKYRRNPFNPEGAPKYWYDKGCNTALYNAGKMAYGKRVIVVEGEFDAMLLESHGYLAVTSTGGAQSFQESWAPLFQDKEVIVCFDHDTAGFEGAQKVIKILGCAKLALLPKTMCDHEDITDYITKYNLDPEKLFSKSVEICLYKPKTDPQTKEEIQEAITKFKASLVEIKNKELLLGREYGKDIDLKHLRSWVNAGLQNLDYLLHPTKHQKLDGSAISNAKQVPIRQLYSGKLTQRSNLLVGLCPFHNEKSPSFTIYLRRNRWYCYGCSSGYDAIDFVMKRDNCTFNDALKKLNNQ